MLKKPLSSQNEKFSNEKYGFKVMILNDDNTLSSLFGQQITGQPKSLKFKFLETYISPPNMWGFFSNTSDEAKEYKSRFKEPSRHKFERKFKYEDLVIVKIEMGGEVIADNFGFRCEKMKILEIVSESNLKPQSLNSCLYNFLVIKYERNI